MRHGSWHPDDVSVIVVTDVRSNTGTYLPRRHAVPARIVLRKARTGTFTFTLESPTGQILATSADHPNLRAAKAAIASVQKNLSGANVDDRSSSTTAAKKTTARKSAAKKTTAARKTAAKKTTTRVTAAKKTTARKTAAKKTTARKAAPRKAAAKKTTAARKTAVRKTTVRKAAPRKAAPRKRASAS